MRCNHCHTRPTVIDMAVGHGQSVSLRTCCKPQWFRDGQPLGLGEVLGMIPKRTYRSRGEVLA
jgi:hypothetical protein